MMNQMTFHAPRLIEIGGGTVAGTAALMARLGLSRPLIVTDPFMVSSGRDQFRRVFRNHSRAD
jgi:alcohol dehydrogenase class IV